MREGAIKLLCTGHMARLCLAPLLLPVLLLPLSQPLAAPGEQNPEQDQTLTIAFAAEATQLDPTRTTAGVDAY